MSTDEFTIEIEDAQSDYVRVNDIDGRNVVVFPSKVDTAKGDNGEPYEFLVADVIVLDGAVTELMDTIPFVVTDMRLTSQPLVSNGKRMLKKGTDKPFAGKINSQKGKFGNKAYGITTWEPEEPKRALANTEAKKYMQSRATVADADDFS